VILVLLGTNPYSFERLARAMDQLAGQHGWDVFMQTGNTNYKPSNCRYAAFLPRKQVQSLVKDCEVLVAQGGAGSMHEGLAAGRPVVAVPRRPELGESLDHQTELVQALEQTGRLIGVYHIECLYESIQKARSFCACAAASHRIPEIITSYIDTL
jgi:UDP-N-acetylglucosamine transferase subunit ALG13